MSNRGSQSPIAVALSSLEHALSPRGWAHFSMLNFLKLAVRYLLTACRQEFTVFLPLAARTRFHICNMTVTLPSHSTSQYTSPYTAHHSTPPYRDHATWHYWHTLYGFVVSFIRTLTMLCRVALRCLDASCYVALCCAACIEEDRDRYRAKDGRCSSLSWGRGGGLVLIVGLLWDLCALLCIIN